jgi:hypothetical protein
MFRETGEKSGELVFGELHQVIRHVLVSDCGSDLARPGEISSTGRVAISPTPGAQGAVGRDGRLSGPGHWPRKPRLGVEDVLAFNIRARILSRFELIGPACIVELIGPACIIASLSGRGSAW